MATGVSLGQTKAPPLRGAAWVGLFVLLGALVAVVAYYLVAQILETPGSWEFGQDYTYYRNAGLRWLEDGSYYLPRQLTGQPYDFVAMEDVLYPPIALLLFVPMVYTPALLWWAIPAAVMAYAVYRWRPARWSIAVALLLLAWPRSIGYILYGNTDIWTMTGVAGGLLWGWPAALLVLKPTFAPLALIGVRHRSWWVASIALGVVSLAMLPLWFDYVTAMRHLSIGWDYSLGSLPLVVIPLVLWLGRTKVDAERMPVAGPPPA